MWRFPWQTWPEFVLDYPWAADALEVVRFIFGLIDQYGSFAMLLGLWWVSTRLKRERERLGERVDTLAQHVKAATDASDAAVVKAQQASDTILAALASFRQATGASPNGTLQQAAEAAEGTYANWERISEIWSSLKDRIDLRIESISHKRVRDKYRHMDRRTYRAIITRLE